MEIFLVPIKIPDTKLRFSIPKKDQVNLSVFNIHDEKVKELKNEIMKSGYFEVDFYPYTQHQVSTFTG